MNFIDTGAGTKANFDYPIDVQVGDDIEDLDHFQLNALLNIYDTNGKIQFWADKLAAKKFFLNHVNMNTAFFHTLEEKLKRLQDEGYYEPEIIAKYEFSFIKKLFQLAYSFKFRFPTFVGAFKYYEAYTLKTFDGKRYLERYEDRVCMNALTLANGDTQFAEALVEEIMTGRFQPATPTFLNTGKKQRGEYVSCFLLRVEDNMESISRSVNAALQLSKRGGGVAILLSNVREKGAPIKKIENQSSGIVPVMKLYEDAFSYANQLGARQGAGAVYLNIFHADIEEFLDTKRENADEKIRIKTLSLGVVIPDIFFKISRDKEDMYLFSPYDVERVYGVPFADISITEKYYEMVANKNIRKKKVNPREIAKTIASIQCQSGYPYIMYEDHVNRANPIFGRINMSNLCSEILQVNTVSEFLEDLSYAVVGRDISCNLGSQNIANVMDSKDIGRSVEIGIRALTAVSDMSNMECVPSIKEGNAQSHAVGLGQMNLHGFLAREKIFYGDSDCLEFTSAYFSTIRYHAIRTSNMIARERGVTFKDFEKSKYASGEFFDMYLERDFQPKRPKVKALFDRNNHYVPSREDWAELKQLVMRYGLYNAYLLAVPPTGSISYINNATASIHPIPSRIEIRKEGKLGRVYYPAPYMTNDNLEFYQDAYEIGPFKIIDVYSIVNEHTDQGASLTLFFTDKTNTRLINQAQIYAWKKKIKTIYYIRIRQNALDGTEVEGCVSCSL